ncbi:hypothetical protein INT46_005347 [Mucor plumbeus]|uniref:Uncharacterized protein n=1 Tax=Mucor plumbeus TaxID=97098 RepID=A0A8H7QCG8_9FUNG|nr:hypothetical protein INT46_005347 [Mucor plumbeus]
MDFVPKFNKIYLKEGTELIDFRGKYLDKKSKVEKKLVSGLVDIMASMKDLKIRENIKCEIFKLHKDADQLGTKFQDIPLTYFA